MCKYSEMQMPSVHVKLSQSFVWDRPLRTFVGAS